MLFVVEKHEARGDAVKHWRPGSQSPFTPTCRWFRMEFNSVGTDLSANGVVIVSLHEYSTHGNRFRLSPARQILKQEPYDG